MQATEKELSKIFDCEADYGSFAGEKPYAFASFETITGDFHLKLRAHILIGEFKFQAFQEQRLVFEFDARTSASISTEIFDDKKLLIIGDDDSATTFIRIKPDFFVGHQIKGI